MVPVKVQGKDTNGTVAETTYTPKITPVVPTAEPATSTDIQGQTQNRYIQALHLVTLQSQWMMMYQLPLKMAQLHEDRSW